MAQKIKKLNHIINTLSNNFDKFILKMAKILL
jgi:hypothetical protein